MLELYENASSERLYELTRLEGSTVWIFFVKTSLVTSQGSSVWECTNIKLGNASIFLVLNYGIKTMESTSLVIRLWMSVPSSLVTLLVDHTPCFITTCQILFYSVVPSMNPSSVLLFFNKPLGNLRQSFSSPSCLRLIYFCR